MSQNIVGVKADPLLRLAMFLVIEDRKVTMVKMAMLMMAGLY